jgi:hypothetical protein
MSKHKWKDLVELRSSMDNLCQCGGHCTIVIICSSEDGLFTNVEGIKNFFQGFVKMLNVLFVTYLGGGRWKRYNMVDILNAIDDIQRQNFIATPSHQLVTDWVSVSLSKEM